MPIALFLITDAWLQKPDPRFSENRSRSQWDRLRAVSSRQGLEWVIPQQVVPNRVWRPLIRLSLLAIEAASESQFSVKPHWTALCGRLRQMTLSQVNAFFKLILFFSNNPLQFGKTWFISLSLFLLAFSRCSGYNRRLEGVKRFWDLTFQIN